MGRSDELVPLSEARVRFHELIRKLPEKNALLLRHGRPVAIMLHPPAYEALLERVEDLEDRLAVCESQGEPAHMRIPWEKVKAETGLLATDSD